MKTRLPLLLCLIGFILFVAGVALPLQSASASSRNQGFITATPGPDGRILYTVVTGDTCGQIALLHGTTVTTLRQLNARLDQDCTLTVGQQIVVGVVSNAPTAGPAPTRLPATITPTPVSGRTEVCVLLFNDMNGDTVRQENELGIDGGAVSLTNLNGSYSQTQNTSSAVDPDTGVPVRACFADVPAGDYNITMAVPDEYNPTRSLNYTLTVKAGDLAEVGFSAQSKTITVSEPTEARGGSTSSLLGIFGILLLVGGAGLAYYAYRSGQPKSKLKDSPLTKK